MEMSRERLRPSLQERWTQDVASLSTAVLRLIEEESSKKNSGEVRAVVSSDMSIFLLNERRARINEIEERTNTRVIVVSDPTRSDNRFEVSRLKSDDKKNKDSASYDIQSEIGTNGNSNKNYKKPRFEKAAVNLTPPKKPKKKGDGLLKKFLKIFDSNEESASKNQSKHKNQRNKRRPDNRNRRPQNRKPQSRQQNKAKDVTDNKKQDNTKDSKSNKEEPTQKRKSPPRKPRPAASKENKPVKAEKNVSEKDKKIELNTIEIDNLDISSSPEGKKIPTISSLKDNSKTVTNAAMIKFVIKPILKKVKILFGFFAPKFTLTKGDIPSPTP